MTLRSHLFSGSRCAFAAQGSGSDTERTINSSPIVFDRVDLNVCNGYDVTTGRQITWSQVLTSYAHHSVTAVGNRLIPVGCVPSAAVAVCCGAGVSTRGCLPWGMSAQGWIVCPWVDCLPRERVPKGVCVSCEQND